jgi:hypothetical protein
MIRVLSLALLAGLCLSGMLRAEPVIIRNDGGGNITDYRARRDRLAQAAEVRIAGKCLSACTIFTTLPNACVGPNAKIGFHGTSPKSGIPAVDYYLDMRMGEFYRGDVRRLYETKWRFLGGSDQFHVITGRELAKLDPKIRLCKPLKKEGEGE